MSKSTISIDLFAKRLGRISGQTREASLPYHVAYKGADAFQRKDLRDRWMLNHVVGSLAISEKLAERILSKSRTERTKDQQSAYAKASADFSYHVIRPEQKPVEQKSMRISTKHREAAQAYLKLFESVDAALAVLRAVAK